MSSKKNREASNMREIVHLQAGQCGNQIGAKVAYILNTVCFKNVFQ